MCINIYIYTYINKYTHTHTHIHTHTHTHTYTPQVFVGGLAYEADEDDIRSFFEDCGKIEKVELNRREDGRSAGYGHVIFASKSSVASAVEKNGQELKGR